MDNSELHERMEGLFKISPVSVRAGEGETLSVMHRIGRDGGYYTQTNLMDRLGFREEIVGFEESLCKKVADRKEVDVCVKRQWSVLETRMKHVVRDYCKHLEGVYGNGIDGDRFPMFAFVPVNENEEGLYFQGIFDLKEKRLLVGRSEDATFWIEEVLSKSKKLKDLFEGRDGKKS